MANIPAKVFIKIESSVEQQDTLNKSRKTLKVLQKAAVDKENLAGRPLLLGKNLTKAKSDDIGALEVSKRKKIENKATQTEAHKILPQKQITEKDLTSNENPGEFYWELLAERQQKALCETLEENKKLYERIEGLEEELDTSRNMFKEAQHLIEVLTEMLNEDSGEQNESFVECDGSEQSEITRSNKELDDLEAGN